MAQREESVARSGYFGNPLEAELPRLELPPEGSNGRSSGSTGSYTGNRNEVAASASLQIAWELRPVLEYFATQVSAQGWAPQGEWENAITAGGAWTRTAGSGAELVGVLNVIRKAPGDYLLEFRLISTPRGRG